MAEYWTIWAGSGVVAIGIAVLLWQLRRRSRRYMRATLTLLTLVCLAVAVPVTGVATYLFWSQHRAAPSGEVRQVVTGVRYERRPLAVPRPLIVHTIETDLTSPDIEFVVTPPSRTTGRRMDARTTSAFAREFDCDVAINANYFRPFHSSAPWDYYPHSGDPCDVLGIAAAAGDVYGVPWRKGVVYISENNQITIDEAPDSIFNAIAGNGVIVRDGEINEPLQTDELALKPYPRSALGLDRERAVMHWVVVDGKQVGYSEGMTLREFANMLVEMKIDVAVRLDEGGSATMVGPRSADGGLVVLNTPTNTRIVGRERPVANHLGIRTSGSPTR